MEPVEMAAQLLKVAAGRHAQVLIRRRVVDHLEPAEKPAFEAGWDVLRPDIAYEEGTQPCVPKSDDHCALLPLTECTTLWVNRRERNLRRNI